MIRITEYLIADHDRLHLLLARAVSRDGVDQEAFASFRAGLLRHIAIEEKLLFPVAAPPERARQLRADHAKIASLLVHAPDLAVIDELAYRLGRHDAMEEGPDGVYAACERALGEKASRELAQRAIEYPAVRVARYRPRIASPSVS